MLKEARPGPTEEQKADMLSRVNHDGRGSRGSRSMLQLIVAGKLLMVARLIS